MQLLQHGVPNGTASHVYSATVQPSSCPSFVVDADRLHARASSTREVRHAARREHDAARRRRARCSRSATRGLVVERRGSRSRPSAS